MSTTTRSTLGLASEPDTKSRRYVFDMTDMVRFAHDDRQTLSGIPRVLLLLTYYARRLRPDAVKIGYFDNVNRCYKELRDEELLINIANLKSVLKKSVPYVKQFKHWKYKSGSLRYIYHGFARNIAVAFKKIKTSIVHLQDNATRRLALKPGDCVVCLGGIWDSLDFFAYLKSRGLLPSGGVDLAILLHDLIPTKMHVTGIVPPAQFNYSLSEVFRLDPKVLVYSDCTRNDVVDWCKRHHHSNVKIGKFNFGDELVKLSGSNIRSEVHALKNTPYILMVGPLTGRKNGGNLLRAWQLIVDRLPTEAVPLLVFAGGEGREAIAQCGFSTDCIAPDRLEFIRFPNDLELNHLYENCLFTVYPSRYEGWGLPIGESLWHGKLCATSNRSSMPEVGGASCDYFDPDDSDDIARVLERLIKDRAYFLSRTVNRAQLKTWQQASLSLLTALDSFVTANITSVSSEKYASAIS